MSGLVAQVTNYHDFGRNSSGWEEPWFESSQGLFTFFFSLKKSALCSKDYYFCVQSIMYSYFKNKYFPLH